MTEPHDGDIPDGLSAAELGMWQSFRNGTTYDLRSHDAMRDDPFAPHIWGPERSVGARTVARLLLSGPPARPGRVAALKLRGVRITGKLDLAGGRVAPYVELTGCRFEQEVVLPECYFTTLRMVGCAVPRLDAARLHTEGDLHLPRCRVDRGIRLTDAQIGTDLLISQISVGPDRRGRAFVGDGMSVAQDLQAEMIETRGELSLRGAKVGGSLSLRGSRLRATDGRRALNAPQLSVERTLYMTEAWVSIDTGNQGTTPPFGIIRGITPARGTRAQVFECRGAVRLDDGRFGDAVDLHKARFVLAPHEELSLRRIVTPELRFNAERPQEGRVVLNGARVVTLIDLSTSWPGPGGLAMGGFVYENLVPYGHFPLSRRLEWVQAATPEYVPEPYERLATVLRNCGEDADAREVLLAKQRQPARDAAARRPALGLSAGLDGGVRLPAGPGRRVDGGAVGGGSGGLLAVPPGGHQGGGASAVERPSVRTGSAGAGDQSRTGRLLAHGGRLAVGCGGPRHAGVDIGHDGGGGRLPDAAPGLT